MPEAHSLYFADLGEGPPLVFLHALGLNSGMWALQVPVFAQRYRVIRPDIRGHGHSPYHGEQVSIQSLSDDLLSILDYLELPQIGLIGLSMGGMIAQQFTISHPERVAALGLFSTVGRFSDEGRQGLLGRAKVAQEQGIASLIPAAIERWFTASFREAANARAESPRTATTQSGNRPLAHSEPVEATLIGTISRMLEYTDPGGYAAACNALAEADVTRHLGKIDCPTLVASGELDPGVSRESQDTLIEGIRGSIEVVVPNASHMLPVECASEFNGHLVNFLAWSNYR